MIVPVPTATSTASSFVQTPLQFSGEFLEFALVFFVLAILAALVGARGIAGVSMEIAKWLVIIFIFLTIVSILL